MGRRFAVITVLLLASMAGCGDQDDTEPPAPEPPELGCAVAERELDDGSCAPPGVMECGEGFSSDDAGGCHPVLPPDPCPEGLMAVPGEADCREISPCGAEPYGDIPVEPGTHHVDAGYLGTGSDGSLERPWPDLEQAVAAAPAGAHIAVAAGHYLGAVLIHDKALRIWGRCPAEVEIESESGAAAISVLGAGSTGTELHGLALTGLSHGVRVVDADDVLLDQLWIHQTAMSGVYATGDVLGLVLQRSLIEHVVDVGVLAMGVELHIEDSLIRDVAPTAADRFGRGVDVEMPTASAMPSTLTLRGSVIERNHEFGVYISGSDAVIERTVVRDTQTLLDDFGRGINAQCRDGRAGVLRLSSSVIEGNVDVGVYLGGAQGEVDSTVVRDTAARPDGLFGRGMSCQDEGQGAGLRSSLTVRHSLVERSSEGAMHVAGSDVVLESTVLRDSLGGTLEHAGRGINVQEGLDPQHRANVVLRWTRIERSHDVAAIAFNSDLSIEQSVVHDVATVDQGLFGDGLNVVSLTEPATLSVTGCAITSVSRAGIANFGAHVRVGTTTFECAPIALHGQDVVEPFSYQDLGGNLCACNGENLSCQVQETELEPPQPVDNGQP